MKAPSHLLSTGGALLICCGLLTEPAWPARKQAPNRPRPSLELEGTGALVPGPSDCSQTTCSGTLTSSLTGAPFGTVNLSLALVVNLNAPSDGCFPATGSGQFVEPKKQDKTAGASFVGEFCGSAASFAYSLNGTVTIPPVLSCQSPETVAIGTLLVNGSVHQSGPVPVTSNPIPPGENSSAIVSVVGASGHVPAPCPSP